MEYKIGNGHGSGEQSVPRVARALARSTRTISRALRRELRGMYVATAAKHHALLAQACGIRPRARGKIGAAKFRI